MLLDDVAFINEKIILIYYLKHKFEYEHSIALSFWQRFVVVKVKIT